MRFKHFASHTAVLFFINEYSSISNFMSNVVKHFMLAVLLLDGAWSSNPAAQSRITDHIGGMLEHFLYTDLDSRINLFVEGVIFIFRTHCKIQFAFRSNLNRYTSTLQSLHYSTSSCCT